MVSEGSLPCSEEPTTGPYPQPEESNPHCYAVAILILSSNLHLGNKVICLKIVIFCELQDVP
jgi:hypothetical protein